MLVKVSYKNSIYNACFLLPGVFKASRENEKQEGTACFTKKQETETG
jgi:hypothetical protein